MSRLRIAVPACILVLSLVTTAWGQRGPRPAELAPARLLEAHPVALREIPPPQELAPEAADPAEAQETQPPAEVIEPGDVVPEERRAAPPESPREYVIDDITIRFAPLTASSQSTIRRAVKRDQAVPDYAAEHFKDLPCVAYGPARGTEGIPQVTGPLAGDFCYRPLYFQEKNLERYGRSWGPVQPVVSGARFFATIPALPYLMTVYNPRTCYDWQYPYPAGFAAPRVRELPPFSPLAGGVESAAALGLIFLIP